MKSTPAKKRHRTRPRDSLDNEDEDRALDKMLVELGIPSSGSCRALSKRSHFEVIELLTPSPPAKTTIEQGNGPFAVVDLTSSPSSTLNKATPVQKAAAATAEQEDEVSFSYSPSASPPPEGYSPHTEPHVVTFAQEEPELLSPEMTRRQGVAQARGLSRQLKDLHSETVRAVGKTKSKKRKTLAYQSVTEEAATRESKAHARSECANERNGGPSAAVIVVVQMEKALDRSEAGGKIRDALRNHVYNGKSVAYTVSSALNCIIPGVIRWERTGEHGSHYACALYYKADAFLSVLQKSYHEVVIAVRYLQTLVPKCRRLCQEEEIMKYVIIIEGMDRALIKLKKQQKRHKNEARRLLPLPMISFADLHEIAIQLFMDEKAHTKFTCDLEASADYVALLTRELSVASSRATALEDQLDSAPRYNSFRVMHSGETASASANAWLRMLQVIPGVSEDKAQCLLNHFPTFHSLMRVYRDPTLSRAQKEDLVADKLHNVRIQRALSKRIYTVFCDENPATIL